MDSFGANAEQLEKYKQGSVKLTSEVISQLVINNETVLDDESWRDQPFPEDSDILKAQLVKDVNESISSDTDEKSNLPLVVSTLSNKRLSESKTQSVSKSYSNVLFENLSPVKSGKVRKSGSTSSGSSSTSSKGLRDKLIGFGLLLSPDEFNSVLDEEGLSGTMSKREVELYLAGYRKKTDFLAIGLKEQVEMMKTVNQLLMKNSVNIERVTLDYTDHAAKLLQVLSDKTSIPGPSITPYLESLETSRLGPEDSVPVETPPLKIKTDRIDKVKYVSDPKLITGEKETNEDGLPIEVTDPEVEVRVGLEEHEEDLISSVSSDTSEMTYKGCEDILWIESVVKKSFDELALFYKKPLDEFVEFLLREVRTKEEFVKKSSSSAPLKSLLYSVMFKFSKG
ncbi:hypothetical protein 2 [Monoclea gottschei varicosa-like virus]|uniref:Uncharacterized protein n=1 Tax=Monoclea gottschei varicosa-like virus TaxID=2933180 RepID=A0A9C7GWF8_9RHAB|nr:hypothetical protein 2 [Monoclea gottschei varicosa-like virus]CAI5383841.1 hypothetical protein 2 [Monoclea gottschei varicosa-like virus]